MLSVLTKYITAIFFLFYFIVILRRKDAFSKKFWAIIKGSIFSSLTMLTVFFPFWSEKNIFAALSEITSSFTDNTFTHLIYRILRIAFPALSAHLFVTVALLVFWVVISMIAVWLLRRTEDKMSVIYAIFFSLVFFILIGSFQFGQWYLLWVAPFVLFLNLRFNFLIYVVLTFGALVSFWKRFPYLLIGFAAIYFTIYFIYRLFPRSRRLLEIALEVA